MPRSSFDKSHEGHAHGEIRKASKKPKTDLGDEVVAALEKNAEEIREDYRPLTESEKARLKAIVNVLPACKPERDDVHVIQRLVDTAEMLEDEDMDSSIVLVLLGMAYERMRSQAPRA
ncbi:MAG: hypothetical protein HY671_09770 [Chloroflexi bacterium]|nr:hypothetical protein [Chloroflexota bacterium]